jgi:hypothetical protein
MKVRSLDKKQAALLIKKIDALYPGRLSLEALTVEVWHRVLSDQDYEKTVDALIKYARENKFPPSAADLYIRKMEAYNSYILEQMRGWEKDATRE